MERKIKFFEDEVELKKYLDKFGFRYGVLGCNDSYVVTFFDNKAGTVISSGIFQSPIAAIRDLNVIVPQTKLPIKDIDVCIEFVFTRDSDKCLAFGYDNHSPMPHLSPYLYFEKKEQVEDKNNE